MSALRPHANGAAPAVDALAATRTDVSAKKTVDGSGLVVALELSAGQVDSIAGRVAGLLAERHAPAELERLLTVDELAASLATTPEWVRRDQAELGAYRLSCGGGRNPIRFRASAVERFLSERRLRPPAHAGDWRTDPDWALR